MPKLKSLFANRDQPSCIRNCPALCGTPWTIFEATRFSSNSSPHQPTHRLYPLLKDHMLVHAPPNSNSCTCVIPVFRLLTQQRHEYSPSTFCFQDNSCNSGTSVVPVFRLLTQQRHMYSPNTFCFQTFQTHPWTSVAATQIETHLREHPWLLHKLKHTSVNIGCCCTNCTRR